MKKLLLVLLVLLIIGGSAFAFDFKTFPSPITKNSIMISPTFNLGLSGVSGGLAHDPCLALGATVAADYALPIPFALTAGIEAGFGTTTEDGFDYFVIPILARVSWHPNFEVQGLDPYITGKIGYAIGIGDGVNGGLSFGGSVGCRYFFNSLIGAFAEGGYDYYKWAEVSSYSFYSYMFAHVGVTFKFGGSSNGGSSSGSASSSARYMLVNSDTLNVRSGPSADNPAVGVLQRNARVQVLDSSGTWWKIKSGNIEGYVNSSYLKAE